MKKDIVDQITVITSDRGEITEIASPEDVQRETNDLLVREFQSDVSGLPEHYVAIAINYDNEESMSSAIEFFNRK